MFSPFIRFKDCELLNAGYQKRDFLTSLRIFADPGLGDLCCIIHLGFQELMLSGNAKTALVISVVSFVLTQPM